MSKIKLPENLSIEKVDDSDTDFILHFLAKGEGIGDYHSEVYERFEWETLEAAALRACERFDWIDHPPATKHAHRIIHNLEEFLEWRGFGAEEPYYWARCFYKYTDCGPWVTFLMQGEDVYYEDIGKDECEERAVRCECTYESGGPHPDDPQEELVVRCDPDPECRHCRGAGERTKRVPTGRKITVDAASCVGIQFGSIVEGSDANSGPFDHMFPFNSMDFSLDEKTMERETSFYWERDNSQWYCVRTPRTEYYLHNTWGEIKWDGDKPSPALRKKIEAFLNTDAEIPHIPEWWGKPQPDWKPLAIPGTKSTIHEYTNDSDIY